MELQQNAINLQLIEDMKKKYVVSQWRPVQKIIPAKPVKSSINIFSSPFNLLNSTNYVYNFSIYCFRRGTFYNYKHPYRNFYDSSSHLPHLNYRPVYKFANFNYHRTTANY